MAMQTITPAYVNMPKEGKSFGSVKLANGNKFVGRAEVLGMMVKGNTYTVETESQDWTNGTVHVITKATLANGSAAAAANGAAGGEDQFAKRPTPPIDAERMFVAGALNSVLPKMFERDQGLLPSKITDTVNMLRLVWSETFGAKHD